VNCDCLQQVLKNVTERMECADRAGPGAKVECGASAITFGEKLESRLYIPFNVAGPNVGYRSSKGKEIPVFCTFCPFCGKSATGDAAPAAAGAQP